MNKKTTKTLKPVLRFKEFTDDWEQRKLGECFSERTERSNTGELISVTINDGIKKFADLNRHDNSSEDKSNYKIVKIGDIAYNSMRMWQGASGYSPYNGILSPAYTVCKPKANMNTHFFSYLFKHSELIHTFKVNSQGLTKDTWNLKFPSFSTIKVLVPQHNEQEKISKVFANIDNLITLHQRKCDQLTTLKKYMLANMFPQEGELTPKIRFSGFTDAWKQRKLGEVCEEFQSGKSIKSADIKENGEYPVFGGNGFRGYTDSYNHDGLFALIGRQGALCGNMNLSTGRAYFTEHAVAVKGNKDNDTRFLYYLLDLMNLGQYSGQSAQPGLAVNKLIQLFAMMPNRDEQQQIGAFFANLDNLITLQQRKCDSLIQAKKFLLHKMFI